MSKKIFVNLPVVDLAASTAFYAALSGEVSSQFSGERSTSLMFSNAIGVMPLTTITIAISPSARSATRCAKARHYSHSVSTNRDAVDATLVCAVAAGGSADPNPAQDHGFTYGRSTEDPNGYVWKIMCMDAESAKGAMQHTTEPAGN
jgi:predicted lactoylglutathione lyase